MKRLFLLAIAAIVTLPLQTHAAEKVLKITNQRDVFPIWRVYITPAGTSGWGQDQLGDRAIKAGESRSWTIPWDGCYVDVQAETFTGLTAEMRNINVCGGFEWTLYDEKPKQSSKTLYDEKPNQQSKTLKIVNKRDAFPIWRVYITPVGASEWGQDQLGDRTINAGESRSWTIPWDGCYVDVQAKTFTGLTVEKRNINVCGGMVWELYDSHPKN